MLSDLGVPSPASTMRVALGNRASSAGQGAWSITWAETEDDLLDPGIDSVREHRCPGTSQEVTHRRVLRQQRGIHSPDPEPARLPEYQGNESLPDAVTLEFVGHGEGDLSRAGLPIWLERSVGDDCPVERASLPENSNKAGCIGKPRRHLCRWHDTTAEEPAVPRLDRQALVEVGEGGRIGALDRADRYPSVPVDDDPRWDDRFGVGSDCVHASVPLRRRDRRPEHGQLRSAGWTAATGPMTCPQRR